MSAVVYGECTSGRAGYFVRHYDAFASEPIKLYHSDDGHIWTLVQRDNKPLYRGTMNTQNITVEINPTTLEVTATRPPEPVTTELWFVKYYGGVGELCLDKVQASHVESSPAGPVNFYTGRKGESMKLVASYEKSRIVGYGLHSLVAHA